MDVFKNFWSFLDNKKKLFFFIIVFFSILQTMFEMIGIAAAIPFVTYLLKPDALKDVSYISNYFDMNKREVAVLSPLVACTLWMGIYPEIFLDVMHVSVSNILEII